MSNKNYYAKGNIKHNGTFYRKGDIVPLDEKSAVRLMDLKVVQTAPIPEEDLADRPALPEGEVGVDSEVTQPEAGGDKPVDTGEPVLNGDHNATPENKGGILGAFRRDSSS